MSEALHVLNVALVPHVQAIPEQRQMWLDRLLHVIDSHLAQLHHHRSNAPASDGLHDHAIHDHAIKVFSDFCVRLRRVGPNLNIDTLQVLRCIFLRILEAHRSAVTPFCEVAFQVMVGRSLPDDSMAHLMIHLDDVERLIRSLLEGKPQTEALQRIGTAKRFLQEGRATVTVNTLLQIEKKALKAGADNLASRAREAIDALYAARAPGIGKGAPGG